MRFVPLAFLALCLSFLKACGSHGSSSDTLSTYGKVQWLDTDQVNRYYPLDVQKMVAAAVVLSTAPDKFSENGFCSGGLIEYKGSEYLLTAGHCILSQAQCEKTYFTPDFEFETEYDLFNYKSPSVVYKCSQLLKRGKVGKEIDYAIASYEIYESGQENGNLVKPFPLRFSPVSGSLDLMAAGHPSNLDDELVQEIRQRSDIDWGAVSYLNSGYTFTKKTVYDCTTYDINDSYFTHDCDTRQSYSGAVIYQYPKMTFVGIHFHAGKHFDQPYEMDPAQLNRATNAGIIKEKLDEIIADRL